MSAQKADFTDIYTQPDPRAYYEKLGSLDYEIPAHGCRVFEAVIDEIRETSGTPTVLDVCCSYGVNAALLNHDVTLDEIAAHYREAEGLAPEEVLALDREWFAERRRPDTVDVVGLDISQAAVDYAVDAGLLASGVVADLENERLSTADAERLAGVDLVTVTGGIGYVNERTFSQILEAADDTPWIAALSLRWVDFDPIAEVFGEHGLITEKLDGYVVPQRRFADRDERAFVLGELDSLGLEPTPVERAGLHGAQLYVARPAADAVEVPLDGVLANLTVDYAVMPPSTRDSAPAQ